MLQRCILVKQASAFQMGRQEKRQSSWEIKLKDHFNISWWQVEAHDVLRVILRLQKYNCKSKKCPCVRLAKISCIILLGDTATSLCVRPPSLGYRSPFKYVLLGSNMCATEGSTMRNSICSFNLLKINMFFESVTCHVANSSGMSQPPFGLLWEIF